MATALKAEGYALIATGFNATATPLPKWDLGRKTAIILGNEHRGVDADLLPLVDGTLYIPMISYLEQGGDPEGRKFLQHLKTVNEACQEMVDKVAMFSLGGNYSPIQRIALAVLGAVFGMAMPFVVLNTIIQRRQERIRRQLPEILDLLCVSVQAGLSFDGAMQVVYIWFSVVL